VDPANPDAPCKETTQQAEKQEGGKADIIFMLDNSGSMGEEVSAVQKNMNAFSTAITQSGIDAHVIVISSPPAPTGATGQGQCIDPTGIACIFVPGLTVGGLGGGLLNALGVCIDPPLGKAGACPTSDESNPSAGFLHVRQSIDSHNALAQAQGTFQSWQSLLRPDAVKTFVVVSDDESRMSAQAFTTWVNGQAVFKSAKWRFSGVFCETQAANCYNIGATYSDLVKQTGGVAGNLSNFDPKQVDAQFKTVFDSLADAIVKDAKPVDCHWNIPAPPNGETLDPMAVNVRYTNGAGATQTIFGVDGAAQCTAQFGGWFYDNPAAPTQVVACPTTCSMVQADLGARINVGFGCAREVPPIPH